MIIETYPQKPYNDINETLWQDSVAGSTVITIICDNDIPMTRVISEDLSIDELTDFIAEQYPGEFMSLDCIKASCFESIAEYMATDEQVICFVLNHPTTTFYDVFVTSVFAWNHANQAGVIHWSAQGKLTEEAREPPRKS